MKIKANHFSAMKAGIEEALKTRNGLSFEYQKAGLSTKRYRWDCLRAATIEGKPGITWICDNLYQYANDDHIDTALRSITNT